MDAETSEPDPKPVHIFRLPIGWILLGAFGLNLIFLLLAARAPVAMQETTAGHEFRPTSQFYFLASLYTLALILGITGLLYSYQKWPFKIIGIIAFGVTAWLIFNAATIDISHHHVLVTDSSVTCVVGPKNKPDTYSIDFSNAAYLSFVKINREGSISHDLIAINQDAQDFRIPMNDLMRAALPKMLETISRYDIALGESESGGFVPAELQL